MVCVCVCVVCVCVGGWGVGGLGGGLYPVFILVGSGLKQGGGGALHTLTRGVRGCGSAGYGGGSSAVARYFCVHLCTSLLSVYCLGNTDKEERGEKEHPRVFLTSSLFHKVTWAQRFRVYDVLTT